MAGSYHQYQNDNPLHPLVVRRHAWGAADMLVAHPLKTPVNIVMYGYTLTTPCTSFYKCKREVRYIQHRNIFKYQLPDIRYNFVIDGFGNIYICRGWRIAPSLPKRYRDFRDNSIYVGVIGYCDGGPPSETIVQAKNRLISYGIFGKHLSNKYLEFNI